MIYSPYISLLIFLGKGEDNMPRYSNLGGDSGVVAFVVGPDWIEVEFGKGQYRYYMYTYNSAGRAAVEEMKKLGAAGSGLNEYINRYVKDSYQSKR
jgi:hypothetical protein